jgi:hypothetical protein
MIGRLANARAIDEIEGCFLKGEDVDLVLGAREGAKEKLNITRTTGNREIDLALDKGLQRLASTFGIDPSFAFFDDKQPNAFAAPESNDESRTGTVLFGKNLFAELQAADPSGVSVLGVAAHEFAHIWQFHSGHYKQIRGTGPTVKRMELNADFLAGYYLGLRKTAHPEASLWIFGEKLWGLGDMNVFARDHHGTPEERTAAAEAGFKLAFVEKRDVAYAKSAGMDYVTRY